jgi:hypothetical protein
LPWAAAGRRCIFTFPLLGLLFVLSQWHRTVIDARPWRPVSESGRRGESISFFYAYAFDLLILRRAHCLRSSVHSLGLFVLRGMEPLAEDFVDYRTRTASRLPKRRKDKVVRKQNKAITVL